MTAPISLREYFASAGSAFTKDEAEVIGPQLEALAEQGEVSERNVVDVARSPNSPLHRFFDWNDESAADKFRLHQAGTMMRSIRVRFVEDDRPRVTPAYKIARANQTVTVARGHNVLHGESAAAVQKAKAAFDELTSWRARYARYVIVWKDFAQAFRGVLNQVSEAEDVVKTAGLDDVTDAALSDLLPVVAALDAWRDKHAGAAASWAGVAEQAGFLVEAIDDAVGTYTNKLKAAERKCLRCRTAFQSGGIGNRLCERCATTPEMAVARIV